MERHLTLTLRLKGKGGLVVGGGKVGMRKIRSLLEQGVTPLTVVDPSPSEELLDLAGTGAVSLRMRPFNAADCDGMDFVMAASDAEAVNGDVLSSARERRVLASSADSQWTQGDFISPATLCQGDVAVSVSTGGTSCRRARLVKDWIGRHLNLMRQSELFIIGTDHHHLPLSRREPCHLNGKRYQETGAMVALLSTVHEFMILNTCNRVELIGTGALSPVTEQTLIRLLGFETLEKSGFYVKRGEEAFRHFAVAAAGLLSQTPGENHITAQIKESCNTACQLGWGGKTLREWVELGIHLARQIRTEVAPMMKVTEIERLCKLYIDRELGGVEGKRVVIVGTGNIGQAVALQLAQSDCEMVWVYHRQVPDMSAFSPKWRLIQLNNLKEELGFADLLIMAANADHPILHSGHAAFLDPDRDFCAIDLSIPRNISPDLVKMASQMRVADLDDLKHWYRREACDMSRILQTAAEILDRHAERTEHWRTSLCETDPGDS